MTSFSYTTGNPSNLTAGATASMNDIQGPFTDLRTFLNGGNLDDSNFSASAGVYTANRSLLRTGAILNAGTTAATYMLAVEGGAIVSGGSFTASASPAIHPALAAAYTISGRTAKLRIRVGAFTNNVPPGVNLNFNLHPVTAVSGGAGVLNVTVGAGVGSGATLSGLAGSAFSVATGSDFNYSTLTDSTAYMLCVTPGGTTAASSFTAVHAILELHWA